MAQDKISEAEVATRAGFGTPASTEVDATQKTEGSEEESGAENDTDEAITDEESGDEGGESGDATGETEGDDANSDTDNGEGESDDDENSDDDSEEESEEDDEEGKAADTQEGNKQRTVPYSKLKTVRQQNKQLVETIDGLRDVLGKLSGKEPSAANTKLSNLEKKAAELGKNLNLDPKGLEQILKAMLELANEEHGDKLPKEVQDRLKALDKFEASSKKDAEAAHFTGEWNAIVPDLQKQYPNATPALLEQARVELDKLAHSKQFHTAELDYILFKNKAKFDTILKVAKGTKSGETGKTMGAGEEEDSGEGDASLVPIEQITPQIMKARDQKELKNRKTSKEVTANDNDITIMEPITAD